MNECEDVLFCVYKGFVWRIFDGCSRQCMFVLTAVALWLTALI